MLMNDKSVYPVNEIIGSFVSTEVTSEDLSSFKSAPHDYLQANMNINYEGDITVVENSDSEIHLALPYYAMVGTLSAIELTPAMLERVSGGEIVITLAAVAGAGIGFAVGGSLLGLTAGSLGAATIIGAGIGAGVATTVSAISIGVGISEHKKAKKNGDK